MTQIARIDADRSEVTVNHGFTDITVHQWLNLIFVCFVPLWS